MIKNKIVNYENIEKYSLGWRNEGKKVVQCHGVFDLLHLGHIKHFKEAKSQGDILIVTITPDEYVDKGPSRPAFKSEERLEVLSSIESIDFVCLNKWADAINIIKLIKPDIYCKGPDYKNGNDDITGKINYEQEAVESIGGSIYITDDITFSSSALINKYGEIYGESQKKFIENSFEDYDFIKVSKLVEQFSSLNVLVIGEAIIDQYCFCEALGKSGKEPVLVLRDLYTEQYSGGAIAIANHLSEFCKSLTFASMLGEDAEHEKFIIDSLPNNIDHYFIYKKNSPTITKKRYVDNVSNSKTLGVYLMNDEQMVQEDEEELHSFRIDNIDDFDLVIVSDYGHGFISKETAEMISRKSNFISVNAQINAANIGYHTMHNYFNADCAIINETEIRHELRDRTGSLEFLMETLTDNLQLETLIVTSGSQGATLYNNSKNEFFYCPAFASKVVDKIGSGDAMLAILSCCLKLGFEPEVALLFGSLAAAQSVESIGNSVPVNKIKMLKSLKALLS